MPFDSRATDASLLTCSVTDLAAAVKPLRGSLTRDTTWTMIGKSAGGKRLGRLCIRDITL
jgi:hypothetical protein